MSNRAETSPIFPVPNGTKEAKSYKKAVEQNAMDLAVFLGGPTIDMIHVASVLPSANFDLLYTVRLGRRDRDGEGNEFMVWYLAESASIRMLEEDFRSMSKKERKRNKDIAKNLKLIRQAVSDPIFWNNPFNPDILS